MYRFQDWGFWLENFHPQTAETIGHMAVLPKPFQKSNGNILEITNSFDKTNR